MTSRSHTPEQLGRYSRAQAYSLPIIACGFALWHIYKPDGELFCTLACAGTDGQTVDDVSAKVDAVVEALNKGLQET